MLCAVFFLPSHIIELTNFSTRVELYNGSGRTSRGSGRLLRGISYLLLPLGWRRSGPTLRTLGAIFGPPLLTVRNAGGIERSANYVVANAGQILYTAAADEHNRMLLQIVSDAGNISGYLDAVGQTHAGHFAKSRIGLLRSGGVYTGANTTALRARLQRRAGGLIPGCLAALAHKLVKGRHEYPLLER